MHRRAGVKGEATVEQDRLFLNTQLQVIIVSQLFSITCFLSLYQINSIINLKHYYYVMCFQL